MSLLSQILKSERLATFIILMQCVISIHSATAIRDTLNLTGEWKYFLLGAPVSIPGEGTIHLPGTLDNAHKSIYNPFNDNTTQLRREFSFSGEATYTRRVLIPDNWAGKHIQLTLERTKPSTICIDGKEIGSSSRISSPQRFDLSSVLTPGNHKIEIKINNADSLPPMVSRSSHAASESTQTNWNGILGEISLQAANPFHIKEIILKENESLDHVTAKVFFSAPAEKNLKLYIKLTGNEPPVKTIIKKGAASCDVVIPITYGTPIWSAQNPNLCEIDFTIVDGENKTLDQYVVTTGLRNFKTDKTTFTINGQPLFLRGTVNAAVFPATTYAPLDEESWSSYFKTLKEYGLNHVRFHSWTPPEAAFNAADKLGFYLQTELPLWGELDRDMVFTNKFLKEELDGIMTEYNRHPSFVMFSTGNELWGDISLMGEYMHESKSKNPRILSTYGSNVYLGMNGEIGGEDFIVAAKIGDDITKSVRGSVSFADSYSGGHFNSAKPESQSNFSAATEQVTVPIVAHETGQYQSYPDFDEIDKYTGNLKPDNFAEFKERSVEAGTFSKNKQFVNSSGRWAAKLYKAEMEMAMRSPGMAGYQLFGIQDYPGQGTALTGILNTLMQSKGFISPKEWKESCNDVALLAEFPSFTFYEGESVTIPIVSVNFTENPDLIGAIDWTTKFQGGTISALPGTGVVEGESIFLKIPKVDKPQKMTLSLESKNADVSNNYDFWVYPKKFEDINNVTVTDKLKTALSLLNHGERVIFCPDSAISAQATLEPLFVNDFWNYRMYRTICDEMGLPPSPGTLGLLINDKHPSLKKFPTDNHTDWQWYPIISASRPLIIDRLPKEVNPIVEVIDNVERNFRLALMLECNVGKGKLIILSANLEKLEESPEGKWLLQSVKEYLGSKDCKPEITLTPSQVENLITKPSVARMVKELKNETYNSYVD